MIKYTLLLVSLLFFGSNLPAQFISVDKASASDVALKPTVETTRAAFLALNGDLQSYINGFLFTDLIQQESSSGIEDGKFYITSEQFYAFSAARRLQIIKQPETYVVVSKLSPKDPIKISAKEVNHYSIEKQKAIRESGSYLIVE